MNDGLLNLLNGDAIAMQKTLADESVHCCVTSPPYYGLRDYGVDGQIGLEETPSEFIEKLVAVFAETWRVLRDDGTLWVNLGDSYASNAKNKTEFQAIGSSTLQGGRANQLAAKYQPAKTGPGIKPKDLMGMPWRLAFALQAAGWYLRSDIIWHKPNPMPESVTDRCTKSHEYLFMLTKSKDYYFDADAIAEKSIYSESGREAVERGGFNGKTNDLEGRESFRAITETRNKRDVWTVPSQPYADAHFACFPPDLVKPCILAGCPVGGMVLDMFGGSGTTGQVAIELGRKATLIELNPAYCALIRQRCAITPGLALA